jgi:ABC-type branched-chain amino acid transport systems, periplasmic component
LNGLLFYPVQSEGEESSRNIFYTGAAPNQQAIPAVRYLMSKEGGEVRRWVLLGTDYIYPRVTNQILNAYLTAEGVSPADIMTIYTPFGHSDWREIVERIKAFASAGKRPRSYQPSTEMRTRISTKNLPPKRWTPARFLMAFSIGERELLSVDPSTSSAISRLELLPGGQFKRKRGVHQNVG